MDFEFAVLEFPETKVAGIKTGTNLQNMQKDCAALWESFGPRVYGELAMHQSIPEMPATYGIWKMIDKDRFEYWAAIEIDSEDKLPADLEILTLPLSMYVTCQVPGISKLGDAYREAYEQWPGSQTDYVLDKEGIGFEHYPYRWQKEDEFEIYVPVKMKSLG